LEHCFDFGFGLDGKFLTQFRISNIHLKCKKKGCKRKERNRCEKAREQEERF